MTEQSVRDRVFGARTVIGVVGGTSVGKTTLVNAWTGGGAPVGLGGITQHPTGALAPSGTLLIDTPSLDEACDLTPLCAHLDAIVWVIDGLRPATQTEREAIAAATPLVAAVHVVISRADLIPTDDLSQIIDRVQHLTGQTATAHNLTANPPALPAVNASRAPRRHQGLHDALTDLLARASLANQVLEHWTRLVRASPLDAVTTPPRLVAVQRMADAHAWSAAPLLPLPAPCPTARRPGPDIARRTHWLAEGHARLSEWLRSEGVPMLAPSEHRHILATLSANPPTP